MHFGGVLLPPFSDRVSVVRIDRTLIADGFFYEKKSVKPAIQSALFSEGMLAEGRWHKCQNISNFLKLAGFQNFCSKTIEIP